MATLCTTFIQELLDLLFLNEALANYGDAPGLQPSSADGSLWVTLHTADPGVGGTAGTNKATFTGYAPVAVARTSAGFTRTGTQMANTSSVAFGENTGSDQTVSHVGLAAGQADGAMLLGRVALSTPIDIVSGMTQTFLAGELVFTFS